MTFSETGLTLTTTNKQHTNQLARGMKMNQLITRLPSHSIDSQVVNVTPQMATLFLERNTKNRSLNRQRVIAHARDMTEGRWILNGETIKFDTEGNLIDGQHRLHAVVDSGRSVKMLVVSNVEPVAMQTIDTGSIRSVGQIVQIYGVSNPNEVSALAGAIRSYAESRHLVWSGARGLSKSEIATFVIENNSQLQEAARFAKNAHKSANIPRVAYGLLAYFAIEKHKKSPELWDSWHAGVTNGADLSKSDPRLALRNLMLRRTGSINGYKLQQEQVALVIKAWNAYVNDKPIKVLRWDTSMLPMPEIA